MNTLRRSLSLHPLAASLALVLGASGVHASPLAALAVVNCLDHGAGSLRQAIIDNTSSAPIDLTQLACSRITLTSGSINVQRAQLIQGPGAALNCFATLTPKHSLPFFPLRLRHFSKAISRKIYQVPLLFVIGGNGKMVDQFCFSGGRRNFC